ncbi:MAG TPA: hypothetical protein VN641_20700 [Urbifossiella sp.]|nr:hypothetical protein [Urbifossiella sp.]
MLRRNYSLILMAIWLFIGICLVFPAWILPARAQQHLRAPGGAVEGVGLLAFVFAAYNLARWWAFQQISYRRGRESPRVNPLARQHPERESNFEEPNPALDFLKLPDADKPHPPEPSANGEPKGITPS